MTVQSDELPGGNHLLHTRESVNHSSTGSHEDRRLTGHRVVSYWTRVAVWVTVGRVGSQFLASFGRGGTGMTEELNLVEG